jgi:serine/threonine protein kinase
MSPRAKKACERELKILKEADHPFIIEYIEEFINQYDELWIITKYASGGDLQKLMNK